MIPATSSSTRDNSHLLLLFRLLLLLSDGETSRRSRSLLSKWKRWSGRIGLTQWVRMQ